MEGLNLGAGMVFALLMAGCAPKSDVPPVRNVPPPLSIYGSTATIEIAPVLVAAGNRGVAEVTVRNGGIADLVGAAGADLATHAETQALRYSVDHPDIRIILTVTEGRYRIVARRSAGIRALGDLKGKRIATLTSTSAGYFLAKMLGTAGLCLGDVVPVRVSPLEEMPAALARGDVDAVAVWEPHAGTAALALGPDSVEFPGDGVYRERFNLNTRAASLSDPVKRKAIVRFVREIVDVSAAIGHDAAEARALAAESAGFSPAAVARAWPTLAFPAALPADLPDVLSEEEHWLAGQEGRAPRSRAELNSLIDPSVLAEALALEPPISAVRH
ncbi:ABC transporter substrate-binding protein [Sphingomonas sp. 3-13AW]|uniref:ABC transporter substrate-binding protein n=1 Tax=Sphingomonas sp. 3-13AW TaxID=3050450 RepID=UPI003BB7D1A0